MIHLICLTGFWIRLWMSIKECFYKYVNCKLLSFIFITLKPKGSPESCNSSESWILLFCGPMHCEKYRNFTQFPAVKILWKSSFRIVSGESPEMMRKLCLSQNFHSRKLGEITVFFHSDLPITLDLSFISTSKYFFFNSAERLFVYLRVGVRWIVNARQRMGSWTRSFSCINQMKYLFCNF